MKITKTKLKQIIKEEFATAISEQNLSEGFFDRFKLKNQPKASGPENPFADPKQGVLEAEAFRDYKADVGLTIRALKNLLEVKPNRFRNLIATQEQEAKFGGPEFNEKSALSMFKAMKKSEATIIKYLEYNLKVTSGGKGRHSTATISDLMERSQKLERPGYAPYGEDDIKEIEEMKSALLVVKAFALKYAFLTKNNLEDPQRPNHSYIGPKLYAYISKYLETAAAAFGWPAKDVGLNMPAFSASAQSLYPTASSAMKNLPFTAALREIPKSVLADPSGADE